MMLKRFLCLLVLIVFAAGSAGAEEAYQAHLSVNITTEDARMVLAQLGLNEDKQDAAAQKLADLVNGLSISCTMQESGFSASLGVNSEVLLDISVFELAGNGYMTSSLLPEHYGYTAVSEEELAASQKAAAALDSMDWPAVGADLLTALTTWVDQLPMTVETGNFIGDAYDGGAFRMDISFADSDVARLVESAVAVLDKYGLNDALLADWIGVDGIFASLAEKNKTVAQENRYNYLLRFVENGAGESIGMTLLVFEAEKQVMSLSVGLGDNGVRAIWGYGLNNDNIYIDMILIQGQSENSLDFSVTVYKDTYHDGFRAVEPYLEYMQEMHTGFVTYAENESGAGWGAEVKSYPAGTTESSMRYALEGEMTYEPLSIQQTIKGYLSGEGDTQPDETVTFSLEACEPISWSVEGKEALDVDQADDNRTLSEIVYENAAVLGVKLFQLLPSELITLLMFQ